MHFLVFFWIQSQRNATFSIKIFSLYRDQSQLTQTADAINTTFKLKSSRHQEHLSICGMLLYLVDLLLNRLFIYFLHYFLSYHNFHSGNSSNHLARAQTDACIIIAQCFSCTIYWNNEKKNIICYAISFSQWNSLQINTSLHVYNLSIEANSHVAWWRNHFKVTNRSHNNQIDKRIYYVNSENWHMAWFLGLPVF